MRIKESRSYLSKRKRKKRGVLVTDVVLQKPAKITWCPKRNLQSQEPLFRILVIL